MEAVYRAICRIGIFTLCAQAVVHFRPVESYEKYLKLLVSVMVLGQLLLPLGTLFSGRDGKGTADMQEEFRTRMAQAMEAASESAEEADAILERMTLEEVRRLLEERRAREGEGQEETEGRETGGGGAGQPIGPVTIGPVLREAGGKSP